VRNAASPGRVTEDAGNRLHRWWGAERPDLDGRRSMDLNLAGTPGGGNAPRRAERQCGDSHCEIAHAVSVSAPTEGSTEHARQTVTTCRHARAQSPPRSRRWPKAAPEPVPRRWARQPGTRAWRSQPRAAALTAGLARQLPGQPRLGPLSLVSGQIRLPCWGLLGEAADIAATCTKLAMLALLTEAGYQE
jgi:hypothetical protein